MRVLYPGSFDPITKGHMNIIKQASELFEEVIVAVLVNPNKKNTFFTVKERVDMIDELYKDNPHIKVVSGQIASTDMAIEQDCKAIIRGLRSISDFANEIEMAQINRDISNNQINTVSLFAERTLQNVSSSVVKEVFSLNKDISRYVDPLIKEKMEEKRYNDRF